MTVASLAMQLSDYRTAAIAEVGYGSTAYASLSAGEAAEIDRLILRGERTFWFHPPGVGQAFVWSCLRDPGLLDLWGDIAVGSATVSQSAGTMTASTASFYETMIGKSIVVTTVGTFTVTGYTSSTVLTVTPTASYSTKTFSIASDGTFLLPSDFESPEVSTATFTDNAFVPDIQLVDERVVTSLRATQQQTGYPQFASIRWVTNDGTTSQLQEMVTWPEPDGHYPIALPFIAQPQGMSAANPYPRGGPEMADCLLSVILAVCEEAKVGQRGDRWAEATEKCQAAAQRDRARHQNFLAGAMRADAGAERRLFDMKRLVLPA